MRNFNESLWKINTPIEKNPGYQIQEFVIGKIRALGLGHRNRLPSQRCFAKLNHVSVTTVKRAYQTLMATGWIETAPGLGTFVGRDACKDKQVYADRGFIEHMPIALAPPDSYQPAAPKGRQTFMTIGIDTLSPAFIPLAALGRYMRYYQKKYEKATQIQQVNDLLGLDFREAIRKYFNDTRGFRINAGCIDVLYSRAASLKHVLTLLLPRGEEVINTSAQDIELYNALDQLGTKQHLLDSLHPDFPGNLEEIVRNNPIKVLHLRPQCSYPECNTLSPATCTRILELAKKYRFYIIEEDDYHEFWYEQVPYRPLSAYDHEGHVIYMGVLSQLSTYMINTRVVCACREFVDRSKAMPRETYAYRNLIEEKAIAEMLRSGQLWNDVKKALFAKKIDKSKLEFALNSLIGDLLEVSMSSCGLSLWIKFPDTIDLHKAMRSLSEGNIKVPYNPGVSLPDQSCPYMRLGFGTFDSDEAVNAARLLLMILKNASEGSL